MYVSTPWEVKTASCNTNPKHSLTFSLICLIVGWVHTLHDSRLIIMITQHSLDTLGNHFLLFPRITVWQFFPNKSTLWLSYSILLMVQKSCTTWDVQYPVNYGIFTQYQPLSRIFFHQPYLHGSSPTVEDLTPLEIVLDKEAWMDEIPEDEMSGRWDEIMKFWDPQLQRFYRRGISMVRSRW